MTVESLKSWIAVIPAERYMLSANALEKWLSDR